MSQEEFTAKWKAILDQHVTPEQKEQARLDGIAEEEEMNRFLAEYEKENSSTSSKSA
jgi:hypothetical protein